ncbi:MAG TPA: hypothetical protein VK112_06535, partial [Fodinibius sp.]|nr:hypothetical protein [Fodinibius sp.]
MKNSIIPSDIKEDYLQSKVDKNKKITSQTIHGVPLAKLDGPIDVNSLKFPFPIFGCYCDQDTPENPCPCKNILVWLLESPIEILNSGQRNSKGQEILSFIMPKGAQLAIDLQIPIELGELNRIASFAKHCKSRNTKTPSLFSEKEAPPPLGWLSLAATIGWGIGSLLDDLLGSGEGGNDNFSDDLSDW